MENHQTEANRNSGKEKKMKLDWTYIMERSRSNREKPHQIGILRDVEEEVGRRERGEGKQRMKYEAQENHGTRSKGQLEIAMPGSSSWTPYASQGVKGFDDEHRIQMTGWRRSLVC